MRPFTVLALFSLIAAASCTTTTHDLRSASPGRSVPVADLPAPPVAEQRPVVTRLHGERRIDPYAWMRDRDDPALIPHLEAENAYTASAMAHTEMLQERLYGEMLSHIQESDTQPPYRKGDWWYARRTEQGKAYPIYIRMRSAPEGPEQVILDVNTLAQGQEYLGHTNLAVSPDATILAYSTDTTGAERYTTYFKDLSGGRIWPDAIPNTYYSSAWALDNRTYFYTTVDDANRPHKVWRHTLGADPANDTLVFHEPDERFFVGVVTTSDERYILISSGSMQTTEVNFLDARFPDAEPRTVWPRRQGVEYDLDHHDGAFYIITNAGGATNFKLVRAPVASPESWRTVIPESAEVYLTGVQAFADHLVLTQRRDGLQSVRVRRFSDGEEYELGFDEPAYSVFPMQNEEFDTGTLRFGYMSPVTPFSVFDHDMNSRRRTLVRETPVPNYDRSRYTLRRIDAPARDGQLIPVTLVHRRDLAPSGDNPLLLYAYGSYGASSDPRFDSNAIPLLERGVVLATAHIRGGSEKGRRWYEDGRLRNKMNTFTDFIDAAEFLVDEGWTNPERLAIYGGSAGGLLMGAVVNMRPDLFRAVIASVPFVDVINTMLDPTIPLTVTEWEQWGDPRKAGDYRSIRRYSPYDNVRPTGYPDMLVLAGLNDPRVAYWEPAKWVARLREMKTDDNLLLLRTNMGAGHGGASGRYERLKEIALMYAFVLDRLGVE